MKAEKLENTMPAMRLVKLVREYAGLNPWQMHKAMRKKTVQAYLSLERNAKRITLSDFLQLEKIYIEAGGTK